MQVQHHVGSAVANFGVVMSCQIVEKIGDILGGFVGGMALMGSYCSCVQENVSISNASIVEGNADDLLNVLVAIEVEGLEDF